MTSSLYKLTVLNVYQEVMDDVINNVRELFLEDGVDEYVLQELKQTWETKLLATEALSNSANRFSTASQLGQMLKQAVGQVPPNNHVQNSIAQVVDTKMVPIQITLPAQPGTEGYQRILTIQVPATALQGNQLHKILNGPVITATMSLPQHLASTMLQQHVNAALNSQQQNLTLETIVSQIDGCADMDVNSVASGSGSASTSFAVKKVNTKKYKRNNKKSHKNVQQIDGVNDTSDDDDFGTDDDDGSDDDEQEMDEGGPEEEHLNSEDDVTDEDRTDLFDTDNVIVCQYDKITRCRNKWKFHLKNGIMNLDGEDYVFQKGTGDAEW